MVIWKCLGLATLMSSLAIGTTSLNGRSEITNNRLVTHDEITACYEKKGCTFRTIFGEESSANSAANNTPSAVSESIDAGLNWLIQAQHANGGWGAGSHMRQDIMDPMAINPDPATTAMATMALMRAGSNLESGEHRSQVSKAVEFLLSEIESTPKSRAKITAEENTQIQTKLGNNIDAVLALQCLSNLLEGISQHHPMRERILKATNTCVQKIQDVQQSDGSFAGDGWAGVLQSSLANNALESAKYNGVEVDDKILDKSREFQERNYDASSGTVNTSRGAGVALYSVSGSVRASAKQARKVREEIAQAKSEGKIGADAEINEEVLEEIGFSKDEAMKYKTSYEVYESSKVVAQDRKVLEGFGNNGGEEFLSFLQTGESLIINQDEEWKNWFDSTSGRLVKIQNRNGSWNGHHCITSPVFCTATTLLTLSINNDFDKLLAIGQAD